MGIFNVKNSVSNSRLHSLSSIAVAMAAASSAQLSIAQDQEDAEQVSPIFESIVVWGRSTRLLGNADGGSHGIVGNADFSTRPLMRVGELVEVMPGMVATQHSGPGKANQYFLRGMNLDHGSDFTAIFEGMPLNFRSHAHASGYLDLNPLIPEIVESVEYHKGTYYAFNGDFSAAGSARFKTYDRIEDGYLEATIGNFNHHRLVGAQSIDTADGTWLFAGELLTRDGPWDLPQDQEKTNLFMKYTGTIGGINSQVTAMAYDADWYSTDQIPLREVRNGNLGLFGFVDPTLGGTSSRWSLIGNFDLDNNIDVNAYYSAYEMNLFGNPTYFLNDPVNGDQIEQEDDRAVIGGFIRWQEEQIWGNNTAIPMLGIDVRYDDITDVNLWNTRERQRLGFTRNDSVEELSWSLYGDLEYHWTDTFRTTIGLRGEFFDWDVTAANPLNSGTGNDSDWMPKFNAAWIPADGVEVYFNYGQGFHSNDVRGATITVDPINGDAVDPVDVIAQAEGHEIGVRFEPSSNFNFSAVAFWLELNSELLFVGDAGTSEPNDATKRRGIELSTFWQINDYLVFDATATWNQARFKDAPSGADRIPDAHETTASAGLTYVHPNGFTGSFRMRHFGDAPLEETDTFQKDGTTLFNLGLSYATNRWEVGLDVLNVFDDDDNDIEYYFESQLQNEPDPMEDYHFHPVESRAYRGNFKYKF